MGDSRRSWCALPPPRHAACNTRRLPPPPPVHTPSRLPRCDAVIHQHAHTAQVLSRLGPIVLLFAALFRALTGAAPPAPFPLLTASSAWAAAVCLLLSTAVFAAADVALDAGAWRRSIVKVLPWWRHSFLTWLPGARVSGSGSGLLFASFHGLCGTTI